MPFTIEEEYFAAGDPETDGKLLGGEKISMGNVENPVHVCFFCFRATLQMRRICRTITSDDETNIEG